MKPIKMMKRVKAPKNKVKSILKVFYVTEPFQGKFGKNMKILLDMN